MKRIVQVIVAAIAVTFPVFAQPAIDAKADSVMKSMAKQLDAAKTIAFSAETTVDEVMASGQKLQRGAAVSVLFRRPDRVLAVRDGDTGVRRFAYDGKSVTVFDPPLGLYATAEVTGSIDEVLDLLREKYDLVLPLGNILRKGFYDQVRGRVTSGRYVGLHRVGRIPCHHLAFTSDEADWQVWVEESSNLPRKIVVTYKTIHGSPQFSATIGEWRLSEPMPDKAFDLAIPADASRIELAGKGGGE